jgi:hypothetical protein
MWERIYVDDKIKNKAIKKIKKGEIEDANDFWNHFREPEDFTYELLIDTSESMSPFDNEGWPTIEIHKNDNTLKDEIIWDNGRQKKD